jgi:hypothetical protein
VNVDERVGIEQHEIGAAILCDHAALCLEKLGGRHGRCAQSLIRREPGLDEKRQLFVE